MAKDKLLSTATVSSFQAGEIIDTLDVIPKAKLDCEIPSLKFDMGLPITGKAPGK